MALPTDVSGGIGGGNYFKPAMGQNKILIVGDAVTGYEYWTNQDKCVRSTEKFAETPDIKIRQVKNKKTGEMEDKEDTQKFWWAMPVYDLKQAEEIVKADPKKAGEVFAECIKLWQVSQKAIKENLASLQANPDWGNPVGNYTISIDRKGEGLLTEYTVMANPTKDKRALEAIMAKYAESPMDVKGMMFN
jgi:hypothetical protein